MAKKFNTEIYEIRKLRENQELSNIIDKIKCIHPPFYVSEQFGVSSFRIVKIAYELNLFDDPDACIRIPRVNKETLKKYESTVLFSDYGIMLIDDALNS